MYTSKNTMLKILDLFPDFSRRWKEHLDYWKEGERSIGIDITEFSHYISKKLEYREDYNYQRLFNFIEELIVKGDEEVGTAATTQFLENLINRSSSGHFSLESFAKYLGKESKEYCKAWDKFCGVDNGDIWD